MKTTTFKNNWLTAAGLLLALPTALFLITAFMKYQMGVNGPFDSMEPTLLRWGLLEPLGWNINLLILFGPLVALLLTIFQVLRIRFDRIGEDFNFNFSIHNRWFPLLVAGFSLGLIGILLFYFLGENCNCPIE